MKSKPIMTPEALRMRIVAEIATGDEIVDVYRQIYEQRHELVAALNQIADRGGIPAVDYDKKYKSDKLKDYPSQIAKRALQKAGEE